MCDKIQNYFWMKLYIEHKINIIETQDSNNQNTVINVNKGISILSFTNQHPIALFSNYMH